MFMLEDLRQTKVYQEALEEGEIIGKQEGELIGKQEGMRSLLSKQLKKRFGDIGIYQKQLDNLSVEKLEMLAVSLLDFQNFNDLEQWLCNRG